MKEETSDIEEEFPPIYEDMMEDSEEEGKVKIYEPDEDGKHLMQEEQKVDEADPEFQEAKRKEQEACEQKRTKQKNYRAKKAQEKREADKWKKREEQAQLEEEPAEMFDSDDEEETEAPDPEPPGYIIASGYVPSPMGREPEYLEGEEGQCKWCGN
jgi:hypothetical protein